MRNCVVFHENLHRWNNFYTTAGRDGRDKSQLWWSPGSDFSLFIMQDRHVQTVSQCSFTGKGHLALTLAPLIVWNLFKADSNFDRLSDCFLSWGTYCNCFYWYISFQEGKKVRVSLCIIVEPLGVKRVALTWVEILMCESVLSSLKDLSFIHFFNSWHGKVSLSCTVIHVILYPFPYEPSMNDN